MSEDTLDRNSPPLATGETTKSGPRCEDCETTSTPVWRRSEMGGFLCNACGLYRKTHNASRSTQLKSRPISKRKRNALPKAKVRLNSVATVLSLAQVEFAHMRPMDGPGVTQETCVLHNGALYSIGDSVVVRGPDTEDGTPTSYCVIVRAFVPPSSPPPCQRMFYGAWLVEPPSWFQPPPLPRAGVVDLMVTQDVATFLVDTILQHAPVRTWPHMARTPAPATSTAGPSPGMPGPFLIDASVESTAAETSPMSSTRSPRPPSKSPRTPSRSPTTASKVLAATASRRIREPSARLRASKMDGPMSKNEIEAATALFQLKA